MQRNRNWIWFFVALVLLASVAAAINWTYNARQQLTPEQLKAAMDLWAKNGPTSYDLVIEKVIGEMKTPEKIEARIRDKKVIGATLDGRPLEPRLWGDYDMPSWFGFVEDFLAIDTKPGAPSTFRVAQFDPQTGQLLRFRRRVSGTHERQEVLLRLTPAASSATPPESRGGQVRPEGK